MTGDRRHRPPAAGKSMNLHIFSLCEHRAGAPSVDGQNTVRLEGPPPQSADVRHDTPRPSQLGRFSDRRWGEPGDRRHLWARLSVFAGGLEEDAAIEVCSDARLEAAGVVDVLG